MKRLRGSLIAYPVDAEIKEESESLFGVSEETSEKVYSKLVLAKTNDIMSIIQREYKELKDYLVTDLDDLEKSFAEKALTLLKQREDQILGSFDVEIFNEGQNIQLDNRDFISNVSLEKSMSNLSFPSTDKNHPSGSGYLSRFHYFYQGL